MHQIDNNNYYFMFIIIGISITSASPKKQIVSAGGSVTLFCEVKSDAPVTYEWYKDGKKLTHNGN